VILEMLANVNLGADLGYSRNGRVIVIGSQGDVRSTRDLMSPRVRRAFTLWE
jgi:hypothetical protein